MHEREAHLLSALLRSSRLSVLYGDEGPEKDGLLQDGVLPLLHRRASDAAVLPGLAPRVVIPFADRRRHASGISSQRSVEVAVMLDDWHGAPLFRLHECLHEALGVAVPVPIATPLTLAGSVTTLHRQFGARFLLIFARFDDCLSATPAFVDQLVEAANRQSLPVNFLISLHDRASPLVERLRARMPDFDDHSLYMTATTPAAAPAPVVVPTPMSDLAAAMLRQMPTRPRLVPARPAMAAAEPMPVAAAVAPAPLPALPAAAAPAPVPGLARSAIPPSPSAASSAAEIDFLASVSVILARAADASREDEKTPGRPTAEAPPATAAAKPVAPQVETRTAVPPIDTVLPAVVADTPPAAPRIALTTSRWLAIPATVASLVWIVWAALPLSPTSPAAPKSTVRAPPPVAIAPAAASLTAPPVPDAVPRLVAELARAMAVSTPAAAAQTPSWPDGFIALPGHPGLAVARYDALQSARVAASGLSLRVVTPLVTEELHFLARADSPLEFIHDIAASRLHAGPAGSANALTAATVYRELFNTPMPLSAFSSLDDNSALGALLTGREFDVMVVTGPQPAAWLASLPAATARALKTLKLAPEHPADQRALQMFLPGTLHAGSVGQDSPAAVATLAVMSFLVTSDAVGDSSRRVAMALCEKLPQLRSSGHPKWRDLNLGLQLDIGWPVAPEATQVLRDCSTASAR